MSIRLNPVISTESSLADYTVQINGHSVALDTARVSAVPFNRRWPGHQRGLEQTELIHFLSLETDEPSRFEIKPRVPFETVVIRPLALGIVPEIRTDGTITFTLEHPAYCTVEPYGRNHALHIFADPLSNVPIDRDAEEVLYFGPGEHDVGMIELKSHQTLWLDEGAVVYACVRATDAEHIRILGRGILDNSRNRETILYDCHAENNFAAVPNAVREHTFQLEYCTDVEISGITIRDSLVYNIRPIGCKKLHISRVKIIGCWRYNSDGMDLHNCEDVLIEHCFLRTFDDSICVKGFDCYYEGDVEAAVRNAMYRNGVAYDVFRSIRIRDCTIWNDWGKCLEIGAETRAEEICQVVFENCQIIHVTGAVLDCCNVDYADVHDVVFRNITVEYDEVVPVPKIQRCDVDTYENDQPDYEPTLISATVEFHPEYSAGGTRRGINRSITFQNIALCGRQMPRFFFKGYDAAHPTKDIRIENLDWNGKRLAALDDHQLRLGDFTSNIAYCVSDCAQLEKNTVSANGQLRESDCVRFFNPGGSGKRVLFVGNSITLHGVKPEIGWNNEWGMAASQREADYVHRLMAEIRKTEPDAAFCICQAADWERNYRDGQATYARYADARRFQADLIIMRLIENCPHSDFNCEGFQAGLNDLLRYLNPTGRAQILLTTGFWKHPGDQAIQDYAMAHQLPCVELGDLGERDELKAIGRFEHEGVANHPGDLGMETIAERIFDALRPLL